MTDLKVATTVINAGGGWARDVTVSASVEPGGDAAGRKELAGGSFGQAQAGFGSWIPGKTARFNLAPQASADLVVQGHVAFDRIWAELDQKGDRLLRGEASRWLEIRVAYTPKGRPAEHHRDLLLPVGEPVAAYAPRTPAAGLPATLRLLSAPVVAAAPPVRIERGDLPLRANRAAQVTRPYAPPRTERLTTALGFKGSPRCSRHPLRKRH